MNLALVTARKAARLSQIDLARKVRDEGRRLGSALVCSRSTVARWEAGEATPQPGMLRALEEALGAPAEALGFGEAPVPWLPPPGFAAGVLAGVWVSAYRFPHGDTELHHADLAHVTAEDRHVRAANQVARTEGRAVPFLNELEAELASRHLTGRWRNTSDTRYFGMVHLAVLPGESVMDGYYTGLATDISVSVSRWRWVRVDLGAADPASIALKDPAELYKVVLAHSQYDAPLTLAEIAEDTGQ
jgi:transcriptional regulator with XRE-family HTH domain